MPCSLQRRDLDPLEEADGYVRLRDELGTRQARIAEAVGRSQPSVAKSVGLPELLEDVRNRPRERAPQAHARGDRGRPSPVVVTEHVYLERRCPSCLERRTPRAELAGLVVGEWWASRASGWGS